MYSRLNSAQFRVNPLHNTTIKSRAEIIREYELTASTFDKWGKQAQTTGSFKEKDNLTPEQQELIALRKKNKQLEMENDILKQAVLIFGRKDK